MKHTLLITATIMALLPAVAIAKIYTIEGCIYTPGSAGGYVTFTGENDDAELTDEQFDQILTRFDRQCSRIDNNTDRCCKFTFDGKITYKYKNQKTYNVKKIISIEKLN